MYGDIDEESLRRRLSHNRATDGGTSDRLRHRQNRPTQPQHIGYGGAYPPQPMPQEDPGFAARMHDRMNRNTAPAPGPPTPRRRRPGRAATFDVASSEHQDRHHNQEQPRLGIDPPPLRHAITFHESPTPRNRGSAAQQHSRPPRRAASTRQRPQRHQEPESDSEDTDSSEPSTVHHLTGQGAPMPPTLSDYGSHSGSEESDASSVRSEDTLARYQAEPARRVSHYVHSDSDEESPPRNSHHGRGQRQGQGVRCVLTTLELAPDSVI